jgi:hypothetical protein
VSGKESTLAWCKRRAGECREQSIANATSEEGAELAAEARVFEQVVRRLEAEHVRGELLAFELAIQWMPLPLAKSGIAEVGAVLARLYPNPHTCPRVADLRSSNPRKQAKAEAVGREVLAALQKLAAELPS